MHTHFPLSYEDARRYLEEHAPQMLEALDRDGEQHFNLITRHVDGNAYKRIVSGDLTEEDRRQADGFYITRHAAWVVVYEGAKQDVPATVR